MKNTWQNPDENLNHKGISLPLTGQQATRSGVCVPQQSTRKPLYWTLGVVGLLGLITFIWLFHFSGCYNPDKAYEEAFRDDIEKAYRRVLTKYPGHSLAGKARARLGDLLWLSAQRKPDVDALKALLRDYPLAGFSNAAALLLDKTAWNTASSTNTIQAYRAYVSDYPSGQWVSNAISRTEDLSWDAAVNAGTIDALDSFTNQFATSGHKQDALNKLKQLQKQQYQKIFDADDVEAFKRLDNNDFDQTINNIFLKPPLLIAADTPSEKIAAYLIVKGADVKAKGSDQATALHLAVRSGSMPIIKLLLAHQASPDAGIGKTYSVISFGKDGAASYISPPPSAKKGTPLHWAAFYNRADILDLLIEARADVSADDGFGNTPVHFAAQSGSMRMIRALLKAGANWRLKKNDSSSREAATPLHYARTAEVAEYFVSNGVPIDADSVLGQPIHAATHFDHKEVIDFLLKRGAKIESTCSWELDGWNSVQVTPLWIAANDGHLELIDFLAARGGNVRFEASEGGSLLHAAAMNGDVAVIRRLIELKLPINAPADFPDPHPMISSWGSMTPLGVAILYDNFDAVKVLLQAGADINAQFKKEWTPLYVSLIRRNKALVGLLLEKGAHLPFEYSKIDSRNTSDEIKELLKKHFAGKTDK